MDKELKDKKFVELIATATLSPQITLGQLLRQMQTKADELRVKKEIERQDRK